MKITKTLQSIVLTGLMGIVGCEGKEIKKDPLPADARCSQGWYVGPEPLKEIEGDINGDGELDNVSIQENDDVKNSQYRQVVLVVSNNGKYDKQILERFPCLPKQITKDTKINLKLSEGKNEKLSDIILLLTYPHPQNPQYQESQSCLHIFINNGDGTFTGSGTHHK